MLHALLNALAHGHADWWLHHGFHMPTWPLYHPPVSFCTSGGVCTG